MCVCVCVCVCVCGCVCVSSMHGSSISGNNSSNNTTNTVTNNTSNTYNHIIKSPCDWRSLASDPLSQSVVSWDPQQRVATIKTNRLINLVGRRGEKNGLAAVRRKRRSTEDQM